MNRDLLQGILRTLRWIAWLAALIAVVDFLSVVAYWMRGGH